MPTDREQWMQDEVAQYVPTEVHQALTSAGFKPTPDAGNLWFYDRACARLLFGDDGSDYPTSLDQSVTVCDGVDDEGTDYTTLREALEVLR